MARNVLLSLYDWAQDPGTSITTTGGAWRTQLPPENMLTVQPQLVAQAVDTSVTFTLNLGAVRTIECVHFQRLVTDVAGTIRVVAGSYDSGTVSSWPADANGTYNPLFHAWLGRQRVFVFPAPVLTSSISVTINSVTTPLQIGNMGAMEMWQQPYDMELHWQLGIIDEADVQRLPFGSSYPTLRGKRRKIEFGSGPIDDQQTTSGQSNFDQAFQLTLVNGKSSPVIAIPFPDDTGNIERRAVWGLIATDQTFEGFMPALYHTTWTIEQLI